MIDWHVGDRVEIHGDHPWDGCLGHVIEEDPVYSSISSWRVMLSWIRVRLDGQDGVFGFLDHELTRI